MKYLSPKLKTFLMKACTFCMAAGFILKWKHPSFIFFGEPAFPEEQKNPSYPRHGADKTKK